MSRAFAVLSLLLLSSISTYVNALSESELIKKCDGLSELGAEIMEARQNGAEMRNMLRGYAPNKEQVPTAIIILAYKYKQYWDYEKKIAVSYFKDEIYDLCMEGKEI